MERLSVSTFRFPNLPVSDLLIVKKLVDFSSKIYYSICDISGTEVISSKVIESCEDLIKISVDSLKSGLYILRLYNEDSFVVNSFQVSK